MFSSRKTGLIILVILTSLFVLISCTNNAAEKIYACANLEGWLRVVESPDECKYDETVFEWNVVESPRSQDDEVSDDLQGEIGPQDLEEISCECEISREEYDNLVSNLSAQLCSDDYYLCSIGCVDLQTDNLNCGSCGHRCRDGEGCHLGDCEPYLCGDGEINPFEECDDGNLETGDGCSDTCHVEDGATCVNEPSICGRLAFLTRQLYRSGVPERGFNGLTDADEICTSEANNTGYAGDFKAWLSSDTISAIDRFSISDYKLIDVTGREIASSIMALVETGLRLPFDTPIDNGFAMRDVWTGTSQTGSSLPGETCNDWTSGAGGFGRVGNPDSIDYFWTNYELVACGSISLHLYCIQDYDEAAGNLDTEAQDSLMDKCDDAGCEAVANALVSCVDDNCLITSCVPSWHDVNGNYLDGCECQEDSFEPNNDIPKATNLGTLIDTQHDEIVISGSIVPGTDSDFYTVLIEDVPEIAEIDTFYASIEFVDNPGLNFGFKIYKKDLSLNEITCVFNCSGYPEAIFPTGVMVESDPWHHFQWEGDGNDRGLDVYDNTTFYIIEVYVPDQDSACKSYTLKVEASSP